MPQSRNRPTIVRQIKDIAGFVKALIFGKLNRNRRVHPINHAVHPMTGINYEYVDSAPRRYSSSIPRPRPPANSTPPPPRRVRRVRVNSTADNETRTAVNMNNRSVDTEALVDTGTFLFENAEALINAVSTPYAYITGGHGLKTKTKTKTKTTKPKTTKPKTTKPKTTKPKAKPKAKTTKPKTTKPKAKKIIIF